MDDLALGLAGSAKEQIRAAGQIAALGRDDLGSELMRSAERAMTTGRSWRARVALVEALGRLRWKPALRSVRHWLDESAEFEGMVVAALAASFYRIARSDLEDIEPMLTLIEDYDTFHHAYGALVVIGEDAMFQGSSCCHERVMKIADKCSRRWRHEGMADCRYGVALAAAYWPASRRRSRFLRRCKRSWDQGVVDAATTVLAGGTPRPR